MQFACDIKTIRSAFDKVKPAVYTGHALAVLGGVRIDAADDGTVTVQATNLDLTLTTTFQADVTAPGFAIVHKKLLGAVLKGKGSIAFTADDDDITAVNGSTTLMRQLPRSEWPRIKAAPGGEDAGFVIPRDALTHVLPAAGTDNRRPILGGIRFAGDRMVATDSYRLHEVLIDQAPAEPLLIPADPLAKAAKAAGGDLTMRLDPDGHFVHLAGGDITAVVRLIEGEFPNYKTLIPENQPWKPTVDRDQLIAAIDQVKIMVRDTTTPVRITFPTPTLMQLKVVTQEAGEAATDIECAWPTWQRPSDGFTVSFNPGYFRAAANALPTGPVSIGFIDHLKPADITHPDRPGDHRLLMPVRVP